VDWTFLGGSIANWSFVSFVVIGTVALVTTLRVLRPQSLAVQAGSEA
jgi:disulfide bond formation protein DsbB